LDSSTPQDLDEFENAFKKRLQEGMTKWHPGEYYDFEMRPFLDRMVALANLDLNSCQVLDLGCGTGQVSCYFASRGAMVTAIDCSPSAISFAQQLARARNYQIDWLVGDIRKMELPLKNYNLVIDCRFLHCVVGFTDRSKILANVIASLATNGEFWSETMVGVPRVSSGEGYYLDDEGIFWKALGEDIKYTQAIEKDGKVYSPIRRIHRSIDTLNEELETAGFEILYQEKEEPTDDFSVWMVKTRCKTRFQ